MTFDRDDCLFVTGPKINRCQNKAFVFSSLVQGSDSRHLDVDFTSVVSGLFAVGRAALFKGIDTLVFTAVPRHLTARLETRTEFGIAMLTDKLEVRSECRRRRRRQHYHRCQHKDRLLCVTERECPMNWLTNEMHCNHMQ